MITATVLTENTESDASQVESLLEESLQKEEGGSGGSGGSKSDNDGLLAAYEPIGPTSRWSLRYLRCPRGHLRPGGHAGHSPTMERKDQKARELWRAASAAR
jgi:hypothetical protein